MKKYDSYKDSGIEWIGEIPKHWSVKKLKFLVKEPLKYGANESAEEEILEDPRYIRITDFGNDGKLKNDTFKSLSLEKAENFLLKEGDLLFARSGATVGKTFLFKDYSGIACFAGYLIKASCDLDKMKPEFLYEFTNSGGYENWKQSIFQQSTIQNIGADKYNQLKIGVPPIEEQQSITNYLDHKTTQIDTLIAKKEQFISLLQEERTAVINHAVTKGLDRKAKMKDSGIEWLGEIPEHWEVGKFNLLVNIRHGHQFMNYDFTENGIRIIKITQLHKNGYLDISNCSYISPNRLNEFSSIIIKENDILMCLTGGTIGKIIRVGQVSEPLLQNYRVGHFSSSDSKKIIDDYIFWVMSSDCLISQIFFQMRETGQPNIGMGDFSRMKISFPNVTEQILIVNHIKNKTIEIDTLIVKSLEEIELLKEYKTALISEVVTGKVDVRDVVLN